MLGDEWFHEHGYSWLVEDYYSDVSKEDLMEISYRPLRNFPIYDDGAPDARNWCFIIGQARSGTTAACELITYHRDAAICPEYWLWGIAEKMFNNTNGVARYPTYVKTLVRTRPDYYLKDGMFRASAVRNLFEGIRPRDLTIFGDKKSEYLLINPDLHKVFPNCKLVCTTRDPYDIVASRFDFYAFWKEDKKPEDLDVVAWDTLARVANYNRIIKHESTVWNIHNLNFEDMAEHPVRTTGELLDFLELPRHRFDWDALKSMNYANTVGHWKRVPAVKKLREETEVNERNCDWL